MIVSFTTIPTRIYDSWIALDSLLNQDYQADKILINLPKYHARTGKRYAIPGVISGHPEYNKRFEVNHCDTIDYGPVMKIFGTVKYLKERNYPDDTVIVYCDDDVIYPKAMLSSYANLGNESAWALGAFNFSPVSEGEEITGVRGHGYNSQVIEAFAGIRVTLGMFKDDFEDYIKACVCKDNGQHRSAIKYSDDVMMSNYYTKNSIPLRSVRRKNYDIHSIFKHVQEAYEAGFIHSTYDVKNAEKTPLCKALSQNPQDTLTHQLIDGTYYYIPRYYKCLRYLDELKLLYIRYVLDS